MKNVAELLDKLTPEQRRVLNLRLRGQQKNKGRQENKAEAAGRISPRPRGAAPAPLSFGQQRLWFLDRLDPGDTAHNLATGAELSGRLDTAALARSIRQIVLRHEILRTTFERIDDRDEAVQVVSEPPNVELRFADLAALPPEGRRRESVRLARRAVGRPFDLARGPLLRFLLLRTDADRHVLIMAIHHVISDGWSLAVFLRELSVLYGAFSRRRPSPLPELPIQYRDFAVWQREQLRGERLERHMAFWRRRLADVAPILELPTDRPPPDPPRSRGGQAPVSCPAEIWNAFNAVGKRHGVTAFMAVLAALQTVLGRYSGQDDVVVGTPVAGRDRPELEPLIGFFVNALVLRTDLGGDPRLDELLARVLEVTQSAYDHQEVPFEELVRELHSGRDMTHTPFFRVMLEWQSVPPGLPPFPGLTLEPLRLAAAATRFDLTVSLFESGGALAGSFVYDRDLFDPTTAVRMARHFEAVIAALSSDPSLRLSRVPLLGLGELQQILLDWNDTRAAAREDACLHELFAAQAEASPESVAASCAGRWLSYGRLAGRSRRLARELRAMGVGPETLVGLGTDRSLEMLIGLIAILEAGGAYVPLDPSHPRRRLEVILEDARVAVLVTQRHLVAGMPGGAPRLCVDEDPAPRERRGGAAPAARAAADNLAYVIFTSGSTGRPKGVQITHRTVVNFLRSMQRRPGLDRDDVMLSVTTLAFDIAGLEIFLPLIRGARVEVVGRRTAADSQALAAVLARSRATVMQATPATWRLLLEGGWPGRPGLSALCGGEALPSELAERLESRTGSLWNLYGPTETTVWSTLDAVGSTRACPSVPLGRPIAETRIHLLGRRYEMVPPGAQGELSIAGGGLARGYRGQPARTAERFTPDPYGGEPGLRMYLTGDLARFLPDGRLDFRGRIDHQIKIRGFRIELGEVESVLERHPEVEQAVAAVAGEGRLIAWWTPAGSGPARSGPARADGPIRDRLRDFLADRLPAYMVPSAYVRLDALPLNPNGKVDRKALPLPDHEASAGHVAPRTASEELLAAIWSEILGVDRVGAADGFFDLGGHSMLATRLTSRIRRIFGVELPVRAVFETPVLEDLARRLEASRSGAAETPPPLVPVRRRLEDGATTAPLSFGQQRLWFIQQLRPDMVAYNLSTALGLRGAIDVAALRAAVGEIVRRHEALRTTFPSVDGRPVQRVAAPAGGLPTLADLGALPPAAARRAARRRLLEEVKRPFDLERGPLFRMFLFSLGGAEHVIQASMHHIVSDGASMEIWARELAALYSAFASGRPSPLPELEIQYADFAEWQRQWLQGRVLDGQLAYWKARLAGLPPVLELPTDRPRPAMQSFRGESTPMEVPRPLLGELRAFSRARGVTLFMTMMAAFQSLMRRYSSQTDVAVGTPIAGRNLEPTEPLIGFFVNMLVLRADLSGDPSCAEWLARTREVALAAYSNQDLPFEQLVNELQPERDLGRTPLFQVVFGLQNVHRDALAMPGLDVEPISLSTATAKFDLTLLLAESESRVSGGLEYLRDLFDATTARRLLGHFGTLLRSLAGSEPERRLSELEWLAGHEKWQLLAEWNDTARVSDDEALLHELFERSADRRPEAIAALFGDRHLSYHGLESRADRLAAALLDAGLGPGDLVAVLLERSERMLVAVLGILKAGAAYVPLETRFPEARMKWILERLAVPALVTQGDRLGRIADWLASLAALSTVVCLDEPGTAPALAGGLRLSSRREPARRSPRRTRRRGDLDRLAYVIFTSGSTGTPKGVMVRHRPAANLIDWVNRSFAMGPGDRALFVTSLGFDLSVYDIFGVLAAGGCVRIAAREEIEDPRTLARILAVEPITFWDSAPAALQQVAPFLPAEAGGHRARLRLVFLSGDWIPLSLPGAIRAGFPAARVIALGGATEATVWSNSYPVAAVDPSWRSVPYGRPIPNATYRVLGPALAPQPVGVAGDLYIGGGCLSSGYAAAPDLTARQFLPDPWEERPGAVMYATGDRARFFADGNIEFLGRLDHQVKIRGFRIELGEIEATLDQHAAVRESAVLVRDDGPPAGRRLVAYVVPKPAGGEGPAPSSGLIAELKGHLREKLPDYMVPAFFSLLDALPVTANGKLDRGKLPAPELDREASAEAFVAPRNDDEHRLAEIWSRVLGLARVGVHDNFFELGGDSILSIQVVSQAARSGLRLSPRQIFEHPTVAELAALRETAAGASEPEAGRPAAGPVPLSAVQRWFFASVPLHPHHFNQSLLLELDRRVETASLLRAVTALGRHHGALRLRYEPPAAGGEAWRQVEQAPESFSASRAVLQVDLSALPAARRGPALESAAGRVQGSLDLASGRLVRAVRYRLGTSDRLQLVIHHLAVDGVSWRILLEDLDALLGQLAGGGTAALPPPTSSYRAWAEGMERFAGSQAVAAQEDYWSALLARRIPPLPVDSDAGADLVASARRIETELGEEETRALLQEVQRPYRTQVNDVLLTALAAAFGRWTGHPHLSVDLEGHGREDLLEDVDVTRTVGWFTALYPVVLPAGDVERRPGEALKAVKETLRAVPDRGVGFGLLRYVVPSRVAAARRAAAGVIFNYFGQLDQVLQGSGLLRPAKEPGGAERHPAQERTHLIEVNSGVREGRLKVIWTYSAHRHGRRTVAGLAASFLDGLRALIRHCRSPEAGGWTPSDFPLARLDAVRLDRIAAATGNRLADVYPCSALQQGMLYHSLRHPHSGVYVEQLDIVLRGPVDVGAFRGAWERLAERHTVLRTAFRHDDDDFLQVVYSRVDLPWRLEDWRGLDAAERRERRTAFLAEDRRRGFDLAAAPLMRFTLIRMDDDSSWFVWTHHHALLDGWSLPVLFGELFAFYRAELGDALPSPSPATPFRAYIAWLEGQDHAEAEAFWRRKLEGFAEPTSFALAPTADASELASALLEEALPAEHTGALNHLARDLRVTVNTLLQGVWAVLLGRYSGRDDVVFGVVSSGRSASLAGIENMVGMLINTQPARVDTSRANKLAPWLERIQADQNEARRYEFTPLVEIQKWSEVPFSQPLFDSILVFENYPIGEALEEESERLSFRVEDGRYLEHTNYPVSLVVQPGPELRLRLLFAVGVLSPTAARRLLRQLVTLLRGVIDGPTASLDGLPLLSAAERHQATIEWNDCAAETAAETAAEPLLHRLFERRVESGPDALAAVMDGRWLSYRELDGRASLLARTLRHKGVGPESPVGFLVDRSLEMLEGLWGILKAGGAYVPLDPRAPRERLELLLAEAAVSVLVSVGEPPSSLEPPAGTELVVLGGGRRSAPPAAPARRVRPENPAYVIYTSGTTGTPKGVVVEHRQIVAYLAGVARRIGWAPDARFALLQPITVDLSKTVLFPPFLGGGCLEVIPEELTLEPAKLGELFRRRRIDVVKITPSHLAALRNSPDPDAVLPASRLVVGGEASRLDVMTDLVRRSRCRAFNHYGPTEATVGVLACRVEEGLRSGSTGTVPIGRPMAHSRALVLGRGLEPLPLGAAGELCLGGVSVARGYLGRPALTAERFVPGPAGSPAGERLYRTGDLVRHLDDGKVEILGRIDDQVKVRGFRVEPGEIEAAMCAHPAVAEALVVARELGAGGPQLVGYVVGAGGAGADPGELLGFLRGRLPEHMVPAALVDLPSLPRMAHGKVDRRALPAPEPRRAAAGPPAAPRTPTEELVAGIWEQVLGLDGVGAEDNFFELGGHSLLATQVVSRLRRTFAAEVSLEQLFKTPTPAGLAAALDAGQGRAVDAAPIRPAARSGALPLSFAQERLWLIDRLIPESSAYNIPIALRLDGELEVRALASSLDEVARRHEVLRTTFTEAEDGPVQVIAPAVPRPLPRVDLSALEPASCEAEAERLAGREARRPFDLETGPLWRAVLIGCDPGRHVLLVVLHHIVSDGWSRGVLVHELGALYPAFALGGPSPLSELPVQYADFACWQRQWLTGEELERQLDYWRRRLTGAPAALELPTDRPRPRVASLRGAWLDVELGRDLAGGLAALGREAGATLFMTLMASWASLLSRYTGQDDVVVGTAVANRTRPEIEGLIGFFVNTLVTRIDASGTPPFLQTLDRVRRAALEAYAHQDLPFDRLVEEMEVDRALDRMPLFQVMLVLQNAPREALELPRLRVETREPETRTAKFDLTLVASETAAGLGARLEYSRDLFDATTAARLLARFRLLLAAVVEDPGVALAEAPLLGPAERHALAAEWNDTATSYPGERCVHELFESRAAWAPEHLAVVYGDEALSYAELERRAGRLARVLRSHGVGAGTPVGLCVERSVAMVVGMLGVLEAGGAYVPLDPSYPRERLAFMIEDARLEVLLAREELAGRLPGDEARTVRIDVDRPVAAGGVTMGDAAAGPRRAVTADDLAYVIYTSGSTGTPKGVAVVHRAVVRLVRDTDYVRLTPEDRVAQSSNASFDAATFEIWGALLNGAVLVGTARDVVVSPGELAAWIRDRRIDVAFLTTALFNQVSREAPAAFATLRDLMFGGEAVDPGRVRAVLAAGPPSRLLHVYGPTENTTFSSWYPVREVPEGAATVPIGRPIANSRLYVLDGRLEPVPVGVAGELFVAGDGLAREYLGREELTRERFVENPGRPGERLYRTGDVVCLLADGNVVFQGRRDHQVKLRGFRIELGEVEAVLGSSPEVREAVVLLREDLSAGRGLVGYVAAPAGAVDAGTLRSFLRRRLPDYMVPSAFVVLDSLPLTANGKVDRAALLGAPVPVTGSAASAPPRAPAPDEEILAGLFSEVLGADRVGTGDNFFELGGHSLIATRLVSRLRRTFGVDVALRDLFQTPTVEGLAAHLRARREAGPSAPRPPLVPVARDGATPLSFAQERLWLLHQLEPASPAYNVPMPLRLLGVLRPAALARGLSEVVRRHEALRTTFHAVDGVPLQRVAPATEQILPEVDLAGLTASRRERELCRAVRTVAARPFDLAAGPLLRVAWVRLAPEEHALVATLHHIVSDGWSMGVLADELSAFYRAFSAGRPPSLGELPVQYADFALWQRSWLSGGELERHLEFWRRELDGAPPALALPLDHPRPPVPTFRGAGRPLELSPASSQGLEALSRQRGATLFMTLMAAWASVLARYTGQPDVVVGSPIAGRDHVDVEGLIGFFVNTLVLRTDVSGDPSFGELLDRVRRTALDAYAHQDLPFERLVEELDVERALDRSAVFQVLFALQNTPGPRLDLPGIRPLPLDTGGGSTKFDLTLWLQPAAEGRLSGALEYRRDLFDATTVQRLAEHFASVLGRIVAEPSRRCSELALLAPAQRQQLLSEGSGVPAAPPENVCLTDLFHRQVARAPEAVAVVFEERWSSYGDLDRRANGLAHTLRGLEVGPETRVALFMERSPEMVVGLWGILKAGGSYVPLDPRTPRARLESLLADAGISVRVTDEKHRGRTELPGTAEIVVGGERGGRAGAAPPASGSRPENSAYVIFTSGSTGRPKGVVVEHRQIVSYLRAAEARFGWERAETFALLQPLAADASKTVLFTSLLGGGRLEVVSEERALDAAGLGEFFRRRRIDVLKLAPSLLAALMSSADPDAVLPASHLIVGGEASRHDRLAELARGARFRVFNQYGPTEATVGASVCRVEEGLRTGPSRTTPIGRPLARVRAFVLDRDLLPRPWGVAGELHLGGAGVARGYLDRPASTAAVFVPAPFGGAAGSRLYRTGDVVRFLADGNMEFLGRIDDQVKLRGFRVEPGEIAAVLCRHPAVTEAVVRVRGDGPAARLVGYAALREAGAVTAGELASFLEERLPEHMVPADLVPLAALPRTPHGKVDRGALPVPDRLPRGRATPARDDAELRLTRIWSELLEVPAVGITDNFFDLGGHSLLAVRLMARVEQAFGCKLPLSALFAGPTVRQLAALVHRQPSGGAIPRAPLVEIQPRGSSRPFFCVHPVGGNVFCYLELVRELGPDQPCYGLQTPDPSAPSGIPERLEDLAACYVAAISEVQPAGPYLLGGWSMGAVVAFEMARQLERSGEEVALVAMLDAPPPHYHARGGGRVDPDEVMAGFLRDLTAGEVSVPVEKLRRLDGEARLARTLELAKSREALPATADTAVLRELYEIFRHNHRALRGYRPGPYAGRVDWLRSEATAAAIPENGWEELAAGGVGVHRVPGDHYSMLRTPHVRVLAETLSRFLSRG